jgi:anaerobic selenocysteine-containing dehydrogenase
VALLPLGPQWTLEEPLAPVLEPAAAPATVLPAGEGLWLLSGGTLFLQGSLSQRGTILPGLAKQAAAFLQHAQAARLGLAEGDRARIEGPAGALVLPVRLDDSVPAGSVFVPYAHAEVELNRLGAPAGPGLRVNVRKAAVAERVGA